MDTGQVSESVFTDSQGILFSLYINSAAGCTRHRDVGVGDKVLDRATIGLTKLLSSSNPVIINESYWLPVDSQQSN